MKKATYIFFLTLLLISPPQTSGADSEGPIWVGCDSGIPARICKQFRDNLPGEPFRFTEHKRVAKLLLTLERHPKAIKLGQWFLAQVIPFKTPNDGLSLLALKAIWKGQRHRKGGWLWTTEESFQLLKENWGNPSRLVRKVGDEKFRARLDKRGSRGIIPFDQLRPEWKIGQLAKRSLFIRNSPRDIEHYPLRFPIYLVDRNCKSCLVRAKGLFPTISNRNEQEMTIVMMTGVTALSRGVARLIDDRGTDYPIEDIKHLFQSANFVHVSNEVSFQPDCNAGASSMSFCSKESYLKVLEGIGVNIIELTGNHLVDKGRRWLDYSLDLFEKRGWRWFGGGRNQSDALKPLMITHGPNRIAFLGCNAVGPPKVWADPERSGAAKCDVASMSAQIRTLKKEGYTVIVSIQHREKYQYAPVRWQKKMFRTLAKAGADMVMGSQAHQPQTLEFFEGCFIHYGLGNFLFDQMQTLGTRRQMYDRLIFYKGRLLSIEIETAMLEEFGRPRPTTQRERKSFLRQVFGTKF
jgi:poly-gamma-glutamate synthesis protein (capsule biosynthesis protein)